MRKSVLLAVAGATLAGAIGSASPAFAVNISDKLIQDYSYTTPVLDSDFSLDGTSALMQSSNSTAAPTVAFAAPILIGVLRWVYIYLALRPVMLPRHHHHHHHHHHHQQACLGKRMLSLLSVARFFLQVVCG
jgi:hypothetical protein